MRFINNRFVLVIMVSLLLITACTEPPVDLTKIRPEIEKANQAFMDAFNGGDAAAMAALYTEDGQLLPPNAPVITGQEGIQNFWQMVMDMGIKTAKLETVELFGCSDEITEIGNYSLGDGSGAELDNGKYIVIWAKLENKWELHRDIWNSNMPIPSN